jgi:anthranilate phosphoribosyltransferase
MIREAIAQVAAGNDLTEADAAAVMNEMMSGEATPAQVGAFLVALRMKGESVDEIAGMERVTREKALRVEVEGPLLDTCGSGGAAFDPFNVSTAAAFVCAGAGVKVAKHGNRAVTSASGSADVLEALGAKVDLTPEQVKTCIEKCGFGFMLAPAFHPAFRHVADARREIGVRTIFNLLGPLANPAGAQYQLFGCAEPGLAGGIAEVLGRLGTKHALVVSSEDGMDEVSLSAATVVHELSGGNIRVYEMTPEDAGLNRAPLAQLKSGTPEENAAKMRAIFAGEKGALRDFVLLNAGAGLVAAEKAANIREGVQLAAESIDSGAAGRVLLAFINGSQSFGS